jgi:hypothetical protein
MWKTGVTDPVIAHSTVKWSGNKNKKSVENGISAIIETNYIAGW